MNLQRDRHRGASDVQKIKRGPRPRGGRHGVPGAALPLKNRPARERSKRIKKIIDDSVAFFSVTETSADASRYRCTVKAAGLTNRQSRLLHKEEQLAESEKNQGERANEIDA